MQPSGGAEIPKINFGFCDKFSPLLLSLDILSKNSTLFILCGKQNILKFSDFFHMGAMTFGLRVQILCNFLFKF